MKRIAFILSLFAIFAFSSVTYASNNASNDNKLSAECSTCNTDENTDVEIKTKRLQKRTEVASSKK